MKIIMARIAKLNFLIADFSGSLKRQNKKNGTSKAMKVVRSKTVMPNAEINNKNFIAEGFEK
jgi:hypothetical protein